MILFLFISDRVIVIFIQIPSPFSFGIPALPALRIQCAEMIVNRLTLAVVQSSRPILVIFAEYMWSVDLYRPHLIGSVNLAFNCQMTVRTGKLCTQVDRRVTRVMVQTHAPNRQEHSFTHH